MAKRIVIPVLPKKDGPQKNKKATPKQLEALKKHQYKKGAEWKGNATGRPKGSGSKLISQAYEAILHQEIPDWVKEKLEVDGKVTWSDLIGIQLVKKAAGLKSEINFNAITELREVTEGKLPDSHELTGKDGAPLQAPTFSIPVEFVDPKKKDSELKQEDEDDDN
jgi:hypothetical protein